MKFVSILVALGLLAGVATAVQPTAVDVTFVDAEKFTDAGDAYGWPARSSEHNLEQLRDYIVARVTPLLAEGQRLTIEIADLDLAGEFEPWHGPGYRDVRMVKSLYPPRINLSFRLYDATDRVVAEGSRRLRDLGFMFAATPTAGNDSLRYEKNLLDSWVRREFRPRRSVG